MLIDFNFTKIWKTQIDPHWLLSPVAQLAGCELRAHFISSHLSMHRCCQRPLKGLGTDNTVKATWRRSTQVNMKRVPPRVKLSSVLIQTSFGLLYLCWRNEKVYTVLLDWRVLNISNCFHSSWRFRAFQFIVGFCCGVAMAMEVCTTEPCRN